jgi:hypothetical protein
VTDTAADLAAALAPKKTAPLPLSQGVVVAVDTGGTIPTASVLRDDGSEVAVYPDSSGRLPLLGASVFMASNGADVLILGGEMLAAGTFQSANWDGPNGSVGWGMAADGNLYANSGYFRGVVEGNVFRTAGPGEPRVEIDGPVDARSVSFYSGEPDEGSAGAVRSYNDAATLALELVGSQIEGQPPGRVRITADRTTGDTSLDFTGDNISANGVSISRPPYSSKRRVAGLAVGDSLSSFQVVTFDTNHLVANDSQISFSAGTFTFTRRGVYNAALIFGWDDATRNVGGREVRVSENGVERIIDTMNFVQDRRAFHNCQTDVIVPDETPYTFQFKVGQNSGVELQGTGRCVISRRSDLA